MKKIALFLTAAIMALGAYAQPKLVGHRGSGYGVENTVESFQKGVDLGYHYLETDIKVTKDKRFVCTHDDDDTRLGGTKTIATSTLEELQSETLTQTRNGVTYTGRLCSLEEYMQIAKDGGIGCVIELKWATGINNNDQSNIPALIAAIDAMGMRKDVIILTSMKPCLEYIRTNYPDITLQFLTGQYWSNHFDWCVQWNIDVDIQTGYFDKSTVKKYHDKGLKVNMWTTNDEAGYRTYGNMGCDFITTDRLDGHNLPELDPSITFPPNTTDYPETGEDVKVKGTYETSEISYTGFPSNLPEGTLKRAVRLSEGWVMLHLGADNTPALSLFDDKGTLTAISTEGIEGGTAVLYNIARTADGKLIGCNLAEAATEPFKTYIWNSITGKPEVLYSVSGAEQNGGIESGLIGSAFTVSGNTNDLKTYTTAATGTTYRICGFQTRGSQISAAVCAVDDNAYTQSAWGTGFDLTISPSSRDNIIITSSDNRYESKEYTFDWKATAAPMKEWEPATGVYGCSYFRYGTKLYKYAPVFLSGPRTVLYRVSDTDGGYNVTEAITVCEPADIVRLASHCTNNEGCSAKLSILVEGFGVYNCTFDPQGEVVPPTDLELELKREWILSNTTGNHPGDIDGTNAQQGTAVNGLFYINNCVEKLIHIFDSTGHLGTIPGGSGWGCARDDAGNIVVRDDKLSGDTHKFIIYPAGARPESYGTPVAFETTVPLAGQTNFINASGDLLGDGGIIYLYPNKQTQINIITVENGKVTGTRASGDLKFAGSTAGYVIPVGNDPEHWLYNVRANGIVEYVGGVNNDISTSRASTTAPARNSTGGGAYIIEGGNHILVHNSGANYKGGFTVRDITMDKVIASVDPIGALGYEAGGNYSTFNWITVERKGKADYILYQYCPANGIAVYSLRGKNTGIENVSASETDTFTVDMSGEEIIASEAGLTLYSLSGKQIAATSGNRLHTGALATGIYIVRSASGKACKIAVR